MVKVRNANQFRTEFDDNGRVCTACHEYKAWSEFKGHARSSTKHSSKCKLCYKLERASKGRQKEKYSSKARNALIKKTDPYLHKSRLLRARLMSRFKVGDPLKDTTPSREALEEWLRNQPLFCYYSGIKITLNNMHVDHKNPVARGGTNTLENLCLASAHMNTVKGQMNEQEFKDLLFLVDTWEDKGKALFTRLKMGHF